MHFPDTYYVGVKSLIGLGGKFNLGFITPHSIDSSFKKRKETVDNWMDKDGKSFILINTPIEGFRFVSDIKRSGWFGSGNVVWRVEDPRGFEFEISSDNLSSLMSLTTIKNGEIQGKCIFARDGSKNALLLENSEEYQIAIDQTRRNKSKVSLKDIKISSLVEMQDGSFNYYYGKIYCLEETMEYSRSDRIYNVSHNVKERYLTISPDGETLNLHSSPKISRSLNDIVLNTNKTYPRIGADLKTAIDCVNGSSTFTKEGKIIHVSSKKFTKDDFIYNSKEITGKDLLEIKQVVFKEKNDVSCIAALVYKEKYKDIFFTMNYCGKQFTSKQILIRCNDIAARFKNDFILAVNQKLDISDFAYFNRQTGFYSVDFDKNSISILMKNTSFDNKIKKSESLFFDEFYSIINQGKFKQYFLEVQGKEISIYGSLKNNI